MRYKVGLRNFEFNLANRAKVVLIGFISWFSTVEYVKFL